MVAFTHLHTHSFFSYLDGAASPEGLVERAAAQGYEALALTDHDGVSGAVRLLKASRRCGVRPILGAEVTLPGGSVVALAEGERGHENLCRLLTEAHLSSLRLEPSASLDLLDRHREGLAFLTGYRESVLARDLWSDGMKAFATFSTWVERLGRERIHLEVCRDFLPGNRRLETLLDEIAGRTGVGMVAGNDVHVLAPGDFWIQDLLTAMRLRIPLEEVHPGRRLNGECDLKAPREMAELFADRPRLLAAAHELGERLTSAMSLERRLYPAFPLPRGMTAVDMLRREVYEGALWRYGRVSRSLEERLEHEMGIIAELGFADYFLLVRDVARYARGKGIRMAGRGSVADSVVAYCLGLTEVDAFSRKLLFERFMSRERAERPDIDLDFDYRYRDDIAAYVTRTYGREHVASVATFQTFQARSLVREAGKAFGLPAADAENLAKRLPHVHADALERVMGSLPEMREGIDAARYRWIVRAGEAIAGFPHHIGTHLGGVVVSRAPIERVAPRQMSAKGVEIVPFDKDDVESLGFVKLDLLSLRTLAVLEESCRLRPFAEAPSKRGDDRAVFRRIRKGGTMGVFQLESPAQRALQPRLKANRMEDLVQAVAIIRPGPIKGDMVTPFIERKAGREKIVYPHPDLAGVLEKTYGVVLFQEQVIEIARIIAGFTAGEADELRRVMTHARSVKAMADIGEAFVRRAAGRGMPPEKAGEIFHMLEGYASYGFPEAHAAAFAQTAYQTAYLSEKEPAAFFAALLSHQPLGYYPPHTLVTEARRRGVAFRPLDVNRSQIACTLEEGGVRIGFSLLHGLGQAAAERLVAARGRPYRSPTELRARARIGEGGLHALILAGAFDAIGKNRRHLLLTLKSEGSLFAQGRPTIPDFPPWERFLRQENALPLAGPATIMRAMRPRLRTEGILGTAEAARRRGRVAVAGFPLMPHRPPTRSGRTVVFLSLEDEEGLLDLVMFEPVYKASGGLLFDGSHGIVKAEGRVSGERGGVAMTVERISRWRPREASTRERQKILDP